MVHERFSRRAALGLAGGALSALAVAALGRRGGASVRAKAPLVQDGTPSGDRAIEHPTGAEEVVARIEYVGGLMLPEDAITQLPLASLYGDGLLVTGGPQIAIYPPPALPNLRQLRLTEEGIQEILAAADTARLIGRSRRYDNPLVADAPYTLVTIAAAGEATRTAVYALGTDNPEWTPQKRAEVHALQEFVGLFVDVASWLPDSAIADGDEPYPLDRLQVLAQPYEAAGLDPAAEQPPVDWPLATPPSAFDPLPGLPGAPGGLTCGVVSGDEAAALAAAADANALTPWVSEGQRWRLWLRPLLPDETGCPPRELGLEILPEPDATPAATRSGFGKRA